MPLPDLPDWPKCTALLLALLCAGCTTQPDTKPAAPPEARQPVGDATQASNEAQAAADAAARERLGKLRANVDAAAAAPNIETSPIAVNELTVAQGRLSDVTPDPVEVAAAAERRALQEAGRAEEARANATAAADVGKKDAARIRDLEAEATILRSERDRIAAEFAAQAEKNMLAQQKAIDAALDREKNQVRNDQVAKLNWVGTGCLGAAVASIALVGFFGGLALLRRVAPFAGILAFCGLSAFAAAQLIGAWWFLPAMLAVLGIGATWFGVWMWKHQKRGDLAEELRVRSEKVAAVAKTAVPILDAAYDNGTATLKELAEKLGPLATVRDYLDEHVFTPLSKRMDASTKTAVHEIRAETKQ